MFLQKGALKICSKFTGEHPGRSVIQKNCFAIWHGCFPLNLLRLFRTPFPKNTSGRLLLPVRNPRVDYVAMFFR